jgi:hypothetical protein
MECFKTTPDYNIFCYACKGQGAKCQHHENAHYEELYDHIDINVSHPDNLEDYIAWEMQKFDGGLQSFNKPELPATQLGTLAEVIQPVKDTTTPFSGTIERRQTVVQSISRKANITIAKLYLDDIHKQQSFDVIEKVGDRLPRNLVALFDAEIKRYCFDGNCRSRGEEPRCAPCFTRRLDERCNQSITTPREFTSP